MLLNRYLFVLKHLIGNNCSIEGKAPARPSQAFGKDQLQIGKDHELPVRADVTGATVRLGPGEHLKLTGPEPLYLRAPDVTLPAAPKRVGA